MPRRQFLGAPVAALAAWGLGGCASALAPSTITLSEPELRQLLARQFPMKRQVLDRVELTLDMPELRLQPEANRLAMVLQLGLNLPERAGRQGARGQLAFDSALRLEPADWTLRLAQVRVAQLQLGLGPTGQPAPRGAAPLDEAANPVWRAGALVVAERLLEGMSLYRVSPERQAELRRWGVRPTAVAVTVRGVEVTLSRDASSRGDDLPTPVGMIRRLPG